MTIAQIRYFLTAARTLNFTKAAQQLYISQPALSKQIVAVERELNVLLFIREDNAVRLTPAGEILLREMDAFLQRYDQIVAEVRTANEGYTGTLRIVTLESQWLGPTRSMALQTFLQRYPGISLQLTHGSFREIRALLERGEADLALTQTADVARDKSLLWQPAGMVKTALALSALLPAARQEVVAPEQLREQTFLLLDPRESAAVSGQMRQALAQLGLDGEIRFAPDLTTLMQWVEAGLGVGFANELTNLAANPDVRLLWELPMPPVQLSWVWRQENYNPAIPLLLGCMRK